MGIRSQGVLCVHPIDISDQSKLFACITSMIGSVVRRERRWRWKLYHNFKANIISPLVIYVFLPTVSASSSSASTSAQMHLPLHTCGVTHPCQLTRPCMTVIRKLFKFDSIGGNSVATATALFLSGNNG